MPDETIAPMNLSPAEIERRAAAGDSAAQVLLARRLDAGGQKQSAEAWLRRAAHAGHAEAMLELGQRLLSRPPPVTANMIMEGRRFIAAAAQAGNGPAAHYQALITALDTSTENWPLALDYLGLAAKAGHAPAQLELAFLAGEGHLAEGIAKGRMLAAELCARLRGAVDPGSFTRAPAARTISDSPFVAVAEGFVAPHLCDWIIRQARPKLRQAHTFRSNLLNENAPKDGKAVSRHSAVGPDLDIILLSVLQRIAVLTGLTINGQEPTSVLHYEAGQEYQPHYDFLDPAIPAFAMEIARSGQRAATVLVYLNDDYEGGETDFPQAGMRFKGRKGDAMMFHNLLPGGAPDRKSLHAGLAPTRGEKWLLARACTKMIKAV